MSKNVSLKKDEELNKLILTKILEEYEIPTLESLKTILLKLKNNIANEKVRNDFFNLTGYNVYQIFDSTNYSDDIYNFVEHIDNRINSLKEDINKNMEIQMNNIQKEIDRLTIELESYKEMGFNINNYNSNLSVYKAFNKYRELTGLNYFPDIPVVAPIATPYSPAPTPAPYSREAEISSLLQDFNYYRGRGTDYTNYFYNIDLLRKVNRYRELTGIHYYNSQYPELGPQFLEEEISRLERVLNLLKRVGTNYSNYTTNQDTVYTVEKYKLLTGIDYFPEPSSSSSSSPSPSPSPSSLAQREVEISDLLRELNSYISSGFNYDNYSTSDPVYRAVIRYKELTGIDFFPPPPSAAQPP